MTAPAARPGYSILFPEETVARAAAYLESLRAGRVQTGVRLYNRLYGQAWEAITVRDFLGELIDTKLPQIFAESMVAGNGSDWNLTELGLLGDISIAVRVTIYDNGNHRAPVLHDPPFLGTLVFTPGALLRPKHTAADWTEVTGADGKLSPEGYYGLYARRLLPVFRYVNACAAGPRSAVLTIPGLGCGQFAGPFSGQLGAALQTVLERFLTEHGADFPNLKAVYFDPFDECHNDRREIHGLSYMVRPLRAPGNQAKSQLCRPSAYAEKGDDFSTCALFSIVAWDHVSWPGNDFFGGSRATDDGVKAAATSSMYALTGVQGTYSGGKDLPPTNPETWGEVVRRCGLHLWDPAAEWTSPGRVV